MAEEYDVPGLAQLGQFLRNNLPDALRKRYLARATYYAALEFEQLAHDIVHVRTGNVQEHMATFKRRTSDINHAEYGVGVRKLKLNVKERKLLRIIRRAGKKIAIGGDPYYYYFLERGTSKMPAYPFLRPAFDQGQTRAINAFADRMRAAVETIKAQQAQ